MAAWCVCVCVCVRALPPVVVTHALETFYSSLQFLKYITEPSVEGYKEKIPDKYYIGYHFFLYDIDTLLQEITAITLSNFGA